MSLRFQKFAVGDTVRLLCNDQEAKVVEVIDHRSLMVELDGTHQSWAARGHTGMIQMVFGRRRGCEGGELR